MLTWQIGFPTTTVFPASSVINMGFVIKPLEPQLVDSVVRLEELCFSVPFKKQDILSYLENPLWSFLVATHENELLGYISYYVNFDECQICNVAVFPECRGLGLGSALVEEMISQAKKRGATKFFLEVRESNLSAIKLYEKCGFSRDGVSKNHYSKPLENALLMSLILD